jgi:hypothetical protein
MGIGQKGLASPVFGRNQERKENQRTKRRKYEKICKRQQENKRDSEELFSLIL